jgi:hypothetical protein
MRGIDAGNASKNLMKVGFQVSGFKTSANHFIFSALEARKKE